MLVTNKKVQNDMLEDINDMDVEISECGRYANISYKGSFYILKDSELIKTHKTMGDSYLTHIGNELSKTDDLY